MEIEDSIIKLVILGNTNVGKTSLVNQYLNKEFMEKYNVTVGVDYFNKKIKINDRIIKLQIWDTAGQDRYKIFGPDFFRGTDGCLLVFDVTLLKTFENLSSWRDELLNRVKPVDPKNFPIVVVGNKIDKGNREISMLTAKLWCYHKNNNSPYFETSAKTGQNVELAFQTLVDKALIQEEINSIEIEDNKEEYRTQFTLDIDDQNDESKTKKCKCCCWKCF